MIFSDEIYDRLVMDDYEHVSIASLAPDLFCVTFSGLSKSHMIAGYRIGWMVLSGNKALGKDYIEGLNMLSNMRLCSNVPAQSIVQTALGGYQSVGEYIVPGGRIYEQREYVYKALNDIPGISAVKPKAAFYIFPKIDTARFNITNDEQFALDPLAALNYANALLKYEKDADKALMILDTVKSDSRSVYPMAIAHSMKGDWRKAEELLEKDMESRE